MHGNNDYTCMLQYMYGRSHLQVDVGGDGSVLVAPSMGGMQGDTSMAHCVVPATHSVTERHNEVVV